MATHVRPNASAQTAAHICSEIAAGLDADPETQDLSPFWDTLITKGDTLATQGILLLRTQGRARARVTVRDMLWDVDVAAFARAVLDASGGKFDQIPNTRFFAKVKASMAQRFGVDREIEQGQAWVAELSRDPNEPLAKAWTTRLDTVTKNLDQAGEERMNALKALAMHGVGEILYVEEINVEIDKLEGELKKRFPRQPKRVAAYLAPTRVKRAVKDEEEDQDEGGAEPGEGQPS